MFYFPNDIKLIEKECDTKLNELISKDILILI